MALPGLVLAEHQILAIHEVHHGTLVNDRLCIFANVLPLATDFLTVFTEMSSRVESPVMRIPNASIVQ
ncbi:MAG: hypothetical protein AB7S77_19910 [Desulfatirhabdiaceae bacterium]